MIRGHDGRVAEDLESRPTYALRGRNRNERWAVMRGDWKLVQRRRRMQLFHLEDDPLDQSNLSSRESDVRAGLEGLITSFRQSVVPASDLSTEVTLTPEELEELRSLGYVD